MSVTLELTKVSVLGKEPCYFERGVKEAIYFQAYKPSLNKDGGGGGGDTNFWMSMTRLLIATSWRKVNHPGHSADEGWI